MLERIVVTFSIFIVVFAVAYAGSAAVTARPTPAIAAPVRPLDAAQLTQKLAKLDDRLREAQRSIDEVLAALANANEPSLRDATRVRLDVLYRLERGLTADITRTREALQSLAAARVDGAWQSHGRTNR
jgi:hypothetical protein